MNRAAVMLACILLTSISSADAQPPAPENATAIRLDELTQVSWVWGGGEIDQFNVYGVMPDNTLTLLTSTTSWYATVSSDHLVYAVTAVAGEVESAPTWTKIPCVEWGLDPPRLDVQDCKGYVGFTVPKPEEQAKE